MFLKARNKLLVSDDDVDEEKIEYELNKSSEEDNDNTDSKYGINLSISDENVL